MDLASFCIALSFGAILGGIAMANIGRMQREAVAAARKAAILRS
ncbi:hypothetical protein AB1M95_05675 [Sulfitobacter sp. LCG007]